MYCSAPTSWNLLSSTTGGIGRLGDCSTTTAPMELAFVKSDKDIELNGRMGKLN
jgi:hypothetical protein